MSVINKSVKLNPQIINTLKNHSKDAASEIPDIRGKKIVMGFWHNWPTEGSVGYQLGKFKEMHLTDIPEQYNVVAVAFMKGHGIPTFKPYNTTDEEFRRQIGILNAQGRAVIISLGGADAEIGLVKGQEEALALEIIRLTETYGFDGLDIDLEQTAITTLDNQTVIPAALRLVKDHYRSEGKNFIVSMAPEFPYLRTNGQYKTYITSLEGYYDFIAPQFYNQGGDGLWVEEINGWLAQNNDEQKENFLFYLTDSLINGTRDYIRIPHDKFVIGLPSNNDAAATGYVINPEHVLNALARLEQTNQPIKGLMTWSVNWDDGFDKNAKSYNWEFIKRYGHISGGGTAPEKPATPTGLISTQQTETSITLEWDPASGSNSISYYTLYRNGQIIQPSITTTIYADSGLTSNTEYTYQISATDNKGNTSSLSAEIQVKTQGRQEPGEQWTINKEYHIGNEVNYQGKSYRCLAKHTSRREWTPINAITLWQIVARR